MSEMNKNDKYNADELVAPDWIDNKFLEKVLQNCIKCGNNKIKILKCKITPGSSKNDHYASIMFRASIEYLIENQKNNKIDKISLIIKTIPIVEGYKKELLDKMPAFETEIRMYTKALPKIENILRKYGDETVLAANCLYYSLDPYKVIIFEDLVERGYGTTDCLATLDETKLALIKLAKLHAVSYKLGIENDKDITSFNNGIMNGSFVLNMDIIKNAIPNFKETLSQFDDLKCYIPHIENIEDKILNECCNLFNLYQNNLNGIFVLNHGDFHLKNMMFNWNTNGKLNDLILVDYQMSVFGSPVIDLIYSTIMLMSHDQRCNNRDELFYFYFKNFQDTLKLIEYEKKIPTIADFRMELIKHKNWELFLIIGFLPMVYILTDNEANVASVVEDPNYIKSLMLNPQFIKEIRQLLPKLLYQGYFE